MTTEMKDIPFEDLADFMLYAKGKKIAEMLEDVDNLEDEEDFNALSPDDMKAYNFYIELVEKKDTEKYEQYTAKKV